MGASHIKFVINPLQAYILLPLLLILAVAITTLVNMAGIKEANIAEMIME
jgi:putative ABC transport system permease protein